ncbi:MAG: ABC transporter substrate-binding protein [Sedimentisphaerales bacterium]|nr:ABC transporter substrate-binding protein [Sedimentisphaerales bacterium]
MKRILYIIYFLIAIVALAAVILFIGSKYLSTINNNFNIQNTEKNDKTPQRIVSLAPNITEILFALGLDGQIVAVSNNCDYPPSAADKPKIGTFFNPGTEAIVSYKPDLVITLWFKEQKTVADSLSRLGINVVTVKLEEIDELTGAIIKIGKAAGRQNKAEDLAKTISSEIQKTSRKYQDMDKPKVLWLVQNEPIRVAGRKTFINEIIELAGGQNAAGPTPMQYPQLGSENLLTCGAEVIIHSAMNKNNMEQERQTARQIWKKFPDLPAVKNNRIYVIDPDTTLRLGPRLPQGLKLIAELIHSDTQ